MTVKTSAGSLFYISAGTPATFDYAGYESSNLIFTRVGEIVDMGEFGRAYNLVTHNPVDTRGTQKFKGSFNEGTMELKLGLDTDDAGQIIMKAAALSDSDYSIKIVTQSGDKYYAQAKVMSFRPGIGNVDQITAASATLELTSSSTGVGIVEALAS